MSTHPRSTDEEYALDEDDQRKSEILEAFRHTKAGVWDLYEQTPPRKFDTWTCWIFDQPRNVDLIEELPLVWTVVKDVAKIDGCWDNLSLLVLVKFLASLQPAVSIWVVSHYLTIFQMAMDERCVDKKLLIFTFAGQICCETTRTFLRYWETKLEFSLRLLMKEYPNKELFNVVIDLDMPTSNNSAVKEETSHAEEYVRANGIQRTILVALDLIFLFVSLVVEIGVLLRVVGDQRDGMTLVVTHLIGEAFKLLGGGPSHDAKNAWVAINNDEHNIKLSGIEALATSPAHKKEVIAGNCAKFLKAAYDQAYAHVRCKRAECYEFRHHSRTLDFRDSVSTVCSMSIKRLARVVCLLKSSAHPETIPIFLMTAAFIDMNGGGSVVVFRSISREIKNGFRSLRRFSEIRKIRNQIQNGTVAFPEQSRSLASGISVEFRNVSFRYPNEDRFVLQGVSFKIEKGQLSVIVGRNGSGKSTLLKLILRLYDPTEGTILVNDQDIRTLKLADLRESIAVLFQDYSHFPLSIKDNIALGDPQNAHDETRIQEAARLGGAEEFINKTTRGFNTYLMSFEARDKYSIPSDAKTKSGFKINYDSFCKAIGHTPHSDTSFSGGQFQKLAVSRLFMRSAVSGEARVGLLLVDEPSAALDPVAEHDLFNKFKKLRGEKTMIFSSHRFGRLTKPADLILCMDDARVVETGTHDELMKKGGKYAEMWKLQVEGFE